MLYCGIDPGGDGGVAVIDDRKRILSLIKYNNVHFAKILTQYIGEEMKICIEAVHAIQGARADATFKFGKNTGRAEGIVTTYLTWTNQPIENFTNVVSHKWKADLDIIIGNHPTKEEKKALSIKKAHELFPEVCLLPTPRCVNEHDGMAEALLIAEWLRRKETKCLEKRN